MAVWPELPKGRYAAAVSGGADSVALLWLYFGAIDHVVHVNHGLRGEASKGDMDFVVTLAWRLGVECTVFSMGDVTHYKGATTSDKLRAIRLDCYRATVNGEGLDGVLLGHHADDQAETVAMRLMRGSTFEGLGGMAADTRVEGVRVVRPLLSVRREALREMLREVGQTWREDASNSSDKYGRNRVRKVLAETPGLTEAMLELGAAARAYREGLRAAREGLGVGETVRVGEFSGGPVGRSAARRWLGKWMEAEEVTPAVVERFLAWSGDAGGGARLSLPGKVMAVRSRGVIRVEGRGRE